MRYEDDLTKIRTQVLKNTTIALHCGALKSRRHVIKKPLHILNILVWKDIRTISYLKRF